MPVPRQVTLAPDGPIHVEWNDGHRSVYAARMLRLACPCAGCVDERTGAVRLRPEDVPPDVTANAVARVGNYALSFEWSDGHSTGIYAFDRLRALCACPTCRPG
ncbi:MAG: DUF971 domain-containing protein [Acidobacteriota bacterium]